jgi:hypothetical protein
MTGDDWQDCTDPQKMLRFVDNRCGGRKLRLFAVACCRRIWPFLDDPFSRAAVEVAEQFADGAALEAARRDVREAARRAADSATNPTAAWAAQRAAAKKPSETIRGGGHSADRSVWGGTPAAVVFVVGRTAYGRAGGRRAELAANAAEADAQAAERRSQCELIRCILGNSFWQTPFDPGLLRWNGGTLAKLARAVYEERSFDRLPILADALEDAGCTGAAILGHCRSGGEHVRGCWVVDFLLGKK